jgi:hypothetical protein
VQPHRARSPRRAGARCHPIQGEPTASVAARVSTEGELGNIVPQHGTDLRSSDLPRLSRAAVADREYFSGSVPTRESRRGWRPGRAARAIPCVVAGSHRRRPHPARRGRGGHACGVVTCWPPLAPPPHSCRHRPLSLRWAAATSGEGRTAEWCRRKRARSTARYRTTRPVGSRTTTGVRWSLAVIASAPPGHSSGLHEPVERRATPHAGEATLRSRKFKSERPDSNTDPPASKYGLMQYRTVVRPYLRVVRSPR